MASMREQHQSQLTLSSHGGTMELRRQLVGDFPEIDELCSDEYLNLVLNARNRKFEYARDQKIKRSLEWRRKNNVEKLCNRFRYNMQAGVMEVLPGVDEEDSKSPLLKLCQTRALRILPNCDADGRIVLFAETQLIDFHAVGVEVGLQYHILAIEAVLNLIRSGRGEFPESFVLLVDSTSPFFAAPPPIGALQGLASLLQGAYPDRIHRVFVGPTNIALRGLYQMVSRLLSQSAREKIKLLKTRPNPATNGRSLNTCLERVLEIDDIAEVESVRMSENSETTDIDASVGMKHENVDSLEERETSCGTKDDTDSRVCSRSSVFSNSPSSERMQNNRQGDGSQPKPLVNPVAKRSLEVPWHSAFAWCCRADYADMHSYTEIRVSRRVVEL